MQSAAVQDSRVAEKNFSSCPVIASPEASSARIQYCLNARRMTQCEVGISTRRLEISGAASHAPPIWLAGTTQANAFVWTRSYFPAYSASKSYSHKWVYLVLHYLIPSEQVLMRVLQCNPNFCLCP